MYYVEGNIFESPAQTLVNTVNTVGAMGKGLAKEFKRLFPQMFREYQKLCEAGRLQTGKLWLYPTPHKWVLNFPTKKHWRHPSQVDYVGKGLQAFVSNYDRARISSVAFPQLGCGNGELDWSDVKPLMEKYLKRLPIDIYVYEVNRYAFPEHKDIKRMRQWLMTEPTSYPFDSFRGDLHDLLSKSDVHKDTDGRPFTAKSTDEFVELEQGDHRASVPWHGDESGNGWLELWQFVREKGMCSLEDIVHMGFSMPCAIMALLLELPYIKPFILRGKKANPAIQLKSLQRDLDLFQGRSQQREFLQL